MNYNKSIKYIFFDLDDTLCNYRYAKENAIRKINEKLCLDNIEKNNFWKAYKEIEPVLMKAFLKNEISKEEYRNRRFYDTLSLISNNRLANCNEISQELNKIFMTEGNENITLFNDVQLCLNNLLKEEYGTGILTNGPSDGQRKKINKLCLNKYFRKIYISEEIGFSKPNSNFFYHVLNDLNLNPDEALMIGDSIADDYKGCEAVGIKCILIDRFNENKDFDGFRIETLLELNDLVNKIA